MISGHPHYCVLVFMNAETLLTERSSESEKLSEEMLLKSKTLEGVIRKENSQQRDKGAERVNGIRLTSS